MKLLLQAPNELYRARFVVLFCICQFIYILTLALYKQPHSWKSFAFNLAVLGFAFGIYPYLLSRTRLGFFRFLFKHRRSFRWLFNTADIGYVTFFNDHSIPLIISIDRHTRLLSFCDYHTTDKDGTIYRLPTHTCFISNLLYLALPVNRLLAENYKKDPADQQRETTDNLYWLEGHLLSVARARKLKLLIE